MRIAAQVIYAAIERIDGPDEAVAALHGPRPTGFFGDNWKVAFAREGREHEVFSVLVGADLHLAAMFRFDHAPLSAIGQERLAGSGSGAVSERQ